VLENFLNVEKGAGWKEESVLHIFTSLH